MAISTTEFMKSISGFISDPEYERLQRLTKETIMDKVPVLEKKNKDDNIYLQLRSLDRKLGLV